MARARNIKPGVFRNEMLVERPIAVRLLFIGLWTLADREGRLENKPRKIKLEIFPYDDVDVTDLLRQLEEDEFISTYEADGKLVIQIENFLKHQTPHGTEKDSELPCKSGCYTTHERNSNGYATGSKRTRNVQVTENNVNLTLAERAATVSKRPDILNPDCVHPPVSPQGGSLDGDAAQAQKKQKRKQRGTYRTFTTWLNEIRAKGEKAVSDYKPVWEYAQRAGLPAEFIELAWIKFREKYESPNHSDKTYIDWRRTFRDHVEANWLGLWYWSEKDGQFRLTTAGVQADKATEAAA